ncbi:MAG: hypothetical protein U1F14_01315 [Steroidobacteraceae bacterium]
MNKTRELDPSEVVAVLMPGLDESGERAAIVIVRGSDGQVSVRRMDASDASVRRAAQTGCFRRGTPILDPVSRQVMGYEMEEVKFA